MTTPVPVESFSVSAPVIAEWHDSQVQYLGSRSHQLDLEAQIDGHEREASLRLRVLLALKGFPNQKYVYLLVYPEHVLSIRLHGNDIPEPVRDAFIRNKSCTSADGIVGLHFSLKQPAAVVGPSDTNVQPKTSSSGNVLDSLHSLARATVFAFYVPSRSIPDNQLRALCDLSDGTFRLFSGKFKSLYGGKGATVIGQHGIDDESPPSYDELAPSSPPPRSCPSCRGEPAAKKRKSSTRTAESHDDDWRTAFEQGLERLEKRFVERLDERLAETTKCILEQFEEHLETRLGDIRTEILDEAHERLEEAKDEMDDLLLVRLDDRMLDVKEEMRESVKEELQTVEETIRADLRNALC